MRVKSEIMIALIPTVTLAKALWGGRELETVLNTELMPPGPHGSLRKIKFVKFLFESWHSLIPMRPILLPFEDKTSQSILKEISPGCSLEGLTLRLKLPILWTLVKSWLIGKDPDAERDWRQEGKGTTEDEVAGWHHWLDGHEFKWTLGIGDGQVGLACSNSWGRKESDTTELNWTEWSGCHNLCYLNVGF